MTWTKVSAENLDHWKSKGMQFEGKLTNMTTAAGAPYGGTL